MQISTESTDCVPPSHTAHHSQEYPDSPNPPHPLSFFNIVSVLSFDRDKYVQIYLKSFCY